MPAAGCLSLAQECLRDMLAQSSTFRTLVGAADAATAKAFIYHDGLPAPADGRRHTKAELEAYRPYAILTTDAESGLVRNLDAVDGFDQHGKLYATIVRSTPEDGLVAREPDAATRQEWREIIADILQDLVDLTPSQTDGLIDATKIALEYGPYPSPANDADAQGYWQAAVLIVDY